ncbi:hypothetical protein TTHERM_01074510 (macronuclear) [Tetrahymena thermophila SB210]|uniref:Uncharacterized protein n=1 Tax=Tetrahymena thermophila (strain SB210) TaxID=312017 RepID=Q24FN6_TETTS|nr:hypothetical protein TTHERM_01074510 [Tetrahymena thermophila SB210]EAS06608.2 hypothetical protein TTHERM_01074510 [Tetrahymena thermophila SB210]|eukprot:XP_001026853.2 hypothetical protein TTHERM_01074510 [Tetrahymena thermophila SB210]
MGNFQGKVKLNKYGRIVANEDEPGLKHEDIKYNYQGNQIMKSSVIRVNNSQSPPKKQRNLSSQIKNSRVQINELSLVKDQNDSLIQLGGFNKQQIKSKLRSSSKMERSFRYFKEEEQRTERINRELEKRSYLNEKYFRQLDEISQAMNFVTVSFEIDQFSMVPLNHLANFCNLSEDMKNQNFGDVYNKQNQSKMQKQMKKQQDEQKQKNDNISHLLREKKELIQSLISNHHLEESANCEKRGEPNFLKISQKLINKQQENQGITQSINQYTRPVESYIYPTPESQLISKGVFLNQQNQQNSQHDINLVYLGLPQIVSQRISSRDEQSALQNNISNISIDSQMRQRHLQQQNFIQDTANYIRIEEQIMNSSKSINKKKSIHEMIEEKKNSSHLNSQHNNITQKHKSDQINQLKQFQQSQILNSQKLIHNGENTFGNNHKFRSYSETNIPAKNFEQALDIFEKSALNSQQFAIQKQIEHEQKLSLRQQQIQQQQAINLQQQQLIQQQLQQQQQFNQQQQTNINQAQQIFKDGNDQQQLSEQQIRDQYQRFSLNANKIENTPQFRISSGQNMLSISGKFGLQSHSTTSNEYQSSKGNASPNILNASDRIKQQPSDYAISSEENAIQLQHIMVDTEEAGTQTNESLRLQPHLNYFNKLQQQRMSRSTSSNNRKFFHPLVIGSDEKQSYQRLVNKLKNFYTQQSKFLFDTITNKTYREYKTNQTERDQSLKKKTKKQKKILQINSKPKKKYTENSYVDLHRQQNNVLSKENYQNDRQQRNFNSFNSNHSTSNLQNQSFNKLIVINNTLSSHNQDNNRKYINQNNKNLSISPSNYNDHQHMSSSRVQSQQKNYINQDIEQSNPVSLQKRSSQKSKDIMSKSTQSTQRIQSAREGYRSMSRSSEDIESSPPKYYQKQQAIYSSNFDENEQYEEDENINQNSNTMNISSNTTSDILAPIHISLGVSQFKKKSANNSAIQDSQLISTKQNPQKNQFLENTNQTGLYELSKNNYNNIVTQQSYAHKDQQVNQKQMRKQDFFKQQNQPDKINQQMKEGFSSSTQLNQVQHFANDLNKEDDFIERYIYQSCQNSEKKQGETHSIKLSKVNQKEDIKKKNKQFTTKANNREINLDYSPGVRGDNDNIKLQQAKYFQELKNKYTNKYNNKSDKIIKQ